MTRAITILAALAALLLAGPLSSAYGAVKKPKAGNWTHNDKLSGTVGGKLKVAKKRKKVTKLVLKPNSEDQGPCGATKVSVKKAMKLKKYPRGWGFAKGSLFLEPKRVTFSVAGSSRAGELIFFFDERGKKLTSGVASYDQCRLDFSFRK